MAQALVAGSILPVQAAINGQLRGFLGSAILTSLVSFLTGAIVLATIHLSLTPSLPSPTALSGPKFWMWLGGPLGTVFVITAIVVTPKLGAATTIALIIAGQLCMALLLDQYGLIGLPLREVGQWRLLGAALLVVGSLLISNN